jgi:hypothetical protein
MLSTFPKRRLLGLVLGILIFLVPVAGFAQNNKVMGRLQFDAHGWTNKTAGVWVDKQYVGYVKELHGNRTIFLLPGEHVVQIREAGYQELTENLVVSPGLAYSIAGDLQRDPAAHYSSTPAIVEIYIDPGRAAVFVDGMYAGHADEFDGGGNELLLNPGKHKIAITLPGYKTFSTDVSLAANQVFKLQTKLVAGSILRTDANIDGKNLDSAAM